MTYKGEPYYPVWLDNLADDATLEGAAMEGAAVTTPIHGKPTGVVVTVTRNAAGETEHVVVNHRPRSSLLLFSRLMGQKFASSPLAKHFITGES